MKNVSCEYDPLNGSTNFARCVTHQTRSLGVLLLLYICRTIIIAVLLIGGARGRDKILVDVVSLQEIVSTDAASRRTYGMPE